MNLHIACSFLFFTNVQIQYSSVFRYAEKKSPEKRSAGTKISVKKVTLKKSPRGKNPGKRSLEKRSPGKKSAWKKSPEMRSPNTWFPVKKIPEKALSERQREVEQFFFVHWSHWTTSRVWRICNYQFLITNYSYDLICNELSIPPEFLFYLQSIINFDGICNWFALN